MKCELPSSELCIRCGLQSEPEDHARAAGEGIYRSQEQLQQQQHIAHLTCSTAASAVVATLNSTTGAPVCKHWRTRGCCLLGERCLLRHPPQHLAGRQAQLLASVVGSGGGGAAAAAAADAAACAPRRRREARSSKFRAGAFRRFLLATFGCEALQQGTGVLDVAGGRGELAFELLNFSATPATVVEPRPLDLARRFKQHEQQQQRQQHALWQAQQRPQQQQQPECSAGLSACGPLLPDHLRLVVTPALAACLTRGGGSRSSTPCSSPSLGVSPGSSAASTPAGGLSRASSSSIDAGLLDLSPVGEPGSPVPPASPTCSALGSSGAAPPEWPAVFEQARQVARQGRWARPGSAHEGEAAAAAAAADGSDREQDSSGARSSGGSSSSSSPERATPPAGSRWRKAVAWSIPADTESEEEEAEAEGEWEGSQQGSWWRGCGAAGGGGQLQPPLAAGGAAAACQGAAVAEDWEAHAMLPREVADAGEAWRRFMHCSVVCGMHPDGATEFIVDLAVALDKPFAVVPCCVLGRTFPRRQLGGAAVTQYEQYLAFLLAKHPSIRVATLPFAGRNTVLYRL